MAKPIGIFDSGVGGLTILRELRKSFPMADFVYLGDTARVPYGTRSKETVTHYSLQDATFLKNCDVGVIIVACHTASAYALAELKDRLNIPVIGVLEAAVHEASKISNNKPIGVIGTDGTISSNAYQNALRATCPNSSIYSKSCPMFVPLAEEGWGNDDIAHLVSKKYLSDFKDKISSLILGCTHYPLLKNAIQSAVGENVTLIDPAVVIAREINQEVSKNGNLRLCVTDIPRRFPEIAERFLGGPLPHVEKVDIESIKV